LNKLARLGEPFGEERMRVDLNKSGLGISALLVGIRCVNSSGETNCCDRRIEIFCASARHSDVLPVPGGPCSSINLGSHQREVQFYRQLD
jgi:hypothetical protein